MPVVQIQPASFSIRFIPDAEPPVPLVPLSASWAHDVVDAAADQTEVINTLAIDNPNAVGGTVVIDCTWTRPHVIEQAPVEFQIGADSTVSRVVLFTLDPLEGNAQQMTIVSVDGSATLGDA